MKWSYTNGKLNISSDESDQQFLLKELIEEASRHKAYKKNIFILFVVTSIFLLVIQRYWGVIPADASVYFYIGYFSTPMFLSALFSSIAYALMRKPPKQVRRLNKYFKG